jgi:NADH:ubiquinone oxidoreductase subunit 6 (subunit J)
MPSTVSGLAFWLFAALCVGGALGMLSSKNVVHAAFWLLEVSVAAAGIFFLLSADYVALVQLLVYSVAVAVLMLFTVMITLRRLEDAIRPRDFSPVAALTCVIFGGIMLFLLASFPAQTRSVGTPYDIATIGRQLFSVRGWALPFEIASALLTAALVGAVWWTREGDE